MSATIAGVDSLTVNGFDVTYKESDDFSERIARNQQLLLKEESHFDKVTDPSAGSYYIENLTNSIAEQAWKLFLEIQNEGGFFAAVEAGKVQEAMKATSAKRLKDVSARKEVLLGTNQFPNFSEMAAEKITKEACTCTNCGCETPRGLATLPTVRAAQEFEDLRLATERSAKRPKAFMLTIGNLAMRLARAQFSCNFFACAGYEVIDNLGFATVEEGVAAAQAAGADIIVLCSSDDEYAELAVPAFKAIDGKQIFVVAGAPACMEDLQAAGIENFIHVRVNVLETLKAFNKQLGI
jgi:methylmalonyl-CoA mutase